MPSAEFTTAAAEVKGLTKKPTDQEMLQIYALFKVCIGYKVKVTGRVLFISS